MPDLLEEAILGLAQSNVTDAVEIQTLLGIPDEMVEMVHRTQRDLLTKGYLNEGNTLTSVGKKSLEEGLSITTAEFRTGWLLADQVRGGLFPFIQPGGLRFFASGEIMINNPLVLAPRSAPPTKAWLREHAPLAVSAYNRRRRLVADLDEANAAALDREYDEPRNLELERSEIQDIELLPEEYHEQVYLLVDLIAYPVPGADQVALRTLSPFSLWEQQTYLEALSAIGDEPYEEAVSLLREEVIRALAPDHPAHSDAGYWEWLTPLMRRELGEGVQLPGALFHKLTECEFVYQQAREAREGSYPFRRESAIVTWGVLLELLFAEVTEPIADWTIPEAWRDAKISKSGVVEWYHSQLRIHGKGAGWFNLPPALRSNLEKVVSGWGKKTTYGEIRGSSARDELVRFLLATLQPTGTPSAPMLAFERSIDDAARPFEALDAVVTMRNDAAHGGRKINEASDEEFDAQLTTARAALYSLLRALFSPDPRG